MIDSLITKPIAIVGMSCRLPGADGLGELWKLLLSGRDAITELPHDRLNQELYFDTKKGVRGKTYSKLGGMIPLRPIDEKLVPIASKRWNEFDECHWILSEVASAAWHHAKMNGRENGNVGVYVGHSGGSRQPGELIYATLAEQTANILGSLPKFQELDSRTQQTIHSDLVRRMRAGKSSRRAGGLPHLDASAAARLITEVLGVSGPQMVIDAACASSLAALGMACLGLQSGRIDSAVVAGASYNKCDSLVLFSQAQSCSATGTRPFDENADGLISAEGYIAIVIKTLDRAIEDKDHIWGVLRGIGISTDGRGKSLWAPRREGQLLAVKRAYSADVRPENVQFIEAHATSTQIGDATEIQALADFFNSTANGSKLPIGSIKSNIGHTLETAGLAGLIKTVLAMHHETIPANANLVSPSRSIPWDAIPFEVPTSARPWRAPTTGRPRCGAVNAFGIGGLNVHVVVEQFHQAYHEAVSTEIISRNPANLNDAINKISGDIKSVPIAIIGRGVIVPGACGMEAFGQLIRSGRSELSNPTPSRWRNRIGISSEAKLPWNVPTGLGGYLLDYAYDWRKHRVPPKQVQHANPLQFMLLDAAGQAIEEANGCGKPLHSERTSVVVGTIFGGEFGHQLQMGLRLVELRQDLQDSLQASGFDRYKADKFIADFETEFLKVNPALLDETGSFTSSTLASRITKQYNLMGGAMAIDAAECSALAGLLAATSLLQNESSDAVICASGHRAMDLPAFETLFAKGKLGTNSSDTRCPGEGVAVLVLKRLDKAQRDGNQIYGIIDSIETQRDSGASVTRSTKSLENQIGDLQGAQGLVSILEAVERKELAHQTLEMSANDQITYRIEIRDPKALANVKPSNTKANNPLLRPAKLPPTMPSVSNHHISKRSRFAMFPGQGSQHTRMLEPWYQKSEPARRALHEANLVLRSLGSDGFDLLVERAVSGRDRSSWSTQASMLIADWVLWNAWVEIGVGVDGVAGHSLGELAAMLAAEVWDIESALRFLRLRAEAVDSQGPTNSGLLSIHANIDTIKDLLRNTPKAIFITHHNGPKQVVVGGKNSDLAEFKITLDGMRLSSSILSVPAPFHTPLMSHAALQLSDSIASIHLLPPRVPFLSSVTNRYEAEPDAMRRNLIAQLITPVDYVGLISKLKIDGIEQLVEIGPGQVLTKLHNANLIDSHVKCISMGSAEDTKLFIDAVSSKSGGTTSRAIASSAWREESSQNSIAVTKPISETIVKPDVLLVDATAARRKQMRERAESMAQRQPLVVPKVSEFANDIPTVATRQAITTPKTHENVSQKPESERASSLEAFVRDFIVEQTGYPQDMIQLDWDLEADLGIDSIKLVQLMGELRELFELEPSVVLGSNVRTLRDILNLLDKAGGKREWLDDKSIGGFDDQRDSRAEVARGKSSYNLIHAIPTVAGPVPPTPSNETQSVLAKPATTSDISDEGSSPDPAILESFMIDFVIEQTGYPREMVDLDADLEADLGLDSIKLAQLFGELRSHFQFAIEAEQRTVLSNVKSLSDILKFFAKDQAPKAGVTSQIESPAFASTVSSPEPSINSSQESTSSYVDPVLQERQLAIAIQNQLIEDCSVADEIANERVFSTSSWDLTENSYLRSVADNANVRVENLIGLIDRHGHKPMWRSLREAIEQHSGHDFEQPINKLSTLRGESTSMPPEFEYRDDEVAQRYLLRIEESDLVGVSRRVKWFGRALILGCNPVATALQQRLAAEGVEAECLDATQSLDILLAKLDQCWGSEGIPHLFICTPHDPGAVTNVSDSPAHAKRNQVTLSVFWLCQQWLIRNTRDRNLTDVSIVAMTQLGGDFGFQNNIAAPESGAVAGLLKAILIECWVNGHRGIPIKVIDSQPNPNAETLVDAVFYELANPSFDTEIAWNGRRRSVVRAIPTKAPSRQMRPTPGVWICTGGGRGITARVARELADRYGLSLHLMGTAPEPNVAPKYRDLVGDELKQFKNQVMADARATGKNSVKAWQDMEKQLEIDANLRLFRSQGIEAHYHCCDVSNEAALKDRLDRIRTQFGPIRGCLHGAGVGQDSRFERKRVDKVQECMRAKIDGMVNLMRQTWNDPIEYFIGFGSISGRFGANGHADYSSANEALAKYIGWYRQQRPKVAAVAFHWHAWGDVGMATKPETKLALEMIDMQFMPADEGIRHLIREIESGATEREVLITDDRYYRMFYPAETLTPKAGSNETFTAKSPLLAEFSVTESDMSTDKVSRQNSGYPSNAICRLDAKRDIFLREHVFNNNPLLPFVISLELMCETAIRSHTSKHMLKTAPEILVQDFQAIRGLKLSAGEQRVVTIECTENQKEYQTRIHSEFKNRQGMVMDAKREYSHACIAFGTFERLLDWQKPSIDESLFVSPNYPDSNQAFYVGPSFRVLRRAALASGRVIGQILAPSLIELVGNHRTTDGWMTPSAVLDSCLFTTGILAWNQVKPGISLPVSMERVRVASMPDAGEPCMVESRLVSIEDRHACFDFCLWGRDGRVLVEVRGYRIAWVD
jgi:acyl transferase domain-containing protein/acyl carrier protein/NAD(P)-dependent dehydrogenase (short-subunit alcohol dehydrogenase family)